MIDNNNRIAAQFVSEWDGGFQITTFCTVDLATGRVTPESASEKESAQVDCLDREFVGFNGQAFAVRCDDDSNEYFLADLDQFNAHVKGLEQCARPRFKLVSSEMDQEFHIVDAAGLFVAIAATQAPHSKAKWANKKLSAKELWESVTTEEERERYAAILATPGFSANDIRTLLTHSSN